MKTMKKIVAILAAVLMLCSILPLSAMAAETQIVFELGVNGTATHADGTEITADYTETVGNYTLTITGYTKVYSGARDAMGNSCLKLGTGSVAGSFTISDIPDDVTSVIIAVAAYKAKTATVTVNGTATTLTKQSNNGEYDEITVDTTATKSISVAVSSGYRAMVNSITYVAETGSADCNHDSLECGDTCGECETYVKEHVFANNCAATCSNCDEPNPNYADHVYSGDYDANCNVCGATREVTLPTDPAAIVDLAYTMVSGDAFPAEVTLTGVISSIDEAYNSSYGNVTVTIDVLDSENNLIEGKSIKCYRMVGDGIDAIVVGDTITVTGILMNYYNTIEFSPANMDSYEATGCRHEYTGVETPASCTEAGVMTYTCSLCGDSYTEDIPVTDHSYVDGVCSVCGAEEINVVEYTITFDSSKTQRTSYSTSAQVWQNGALVFTNNKSASTTNVADYGGPVRLYAYSEIVIECPGMTEIVFDCNSASYATALNNSIGSTATTSVSSDKVTVTLDGVDSFTIASLTAQVRMDAITVIAAAQGDAADCEHTNAVACDKYCPDCGSLINEDAAHKSNAAYSCLDGTCEYCGETVEGDGHSFDENDVCTVCGQAPVPENPVDPENPQQYVFSEFAAGTQYAENEKHYLDNAVTVITTESHFTSELRIYSSETHNGSVIIKSTKDISAIVLNAGNKVDVLNLYVSEDGEVYKAIEVTSTSYNEYTVLIPEMTKYIKLDVAGDQQIRVKDMTLYFDGEMPHVCEFVGVETQAPTCTEPGVMTYSCTCGEGTYTEEIPAAHTYDNNCDADCNVCGEYRDAPHNLTTHVEALVPANCQEEGYNEHWICEDCGGYFMANGMGGYYETNPAWMYYTGDHVRPEGSIVCAVVACELCGEDTYGEACTRPEGAPECTDVDCVNCGETIYGWGHNYNTGDEEIPLPLCGEGDCVYCGEHFDKLYDHENGAWAPCLDGECSYGCGLQFPATESHTLEDCTAGGYCQVCWSEIPAGEHTYDDEYDADCNVCGEIREVPEKPVEIVYGDADGNGEIEVLDAALIQQYLAGYEVEMNEAAADADGNGEVEVLDAALIQQFLAGYDVTLGPEDENKVFNDGVLGEW